MSGRRNRAQGGLRALRAAAVVAVFGGVLSVVGAVTPAAAFSSSPQWFNLSGGSVASLACGNWYYSTMGAQTGGGSATVTIIGGGGGGGGSSTSFLSNNANTGTGGAGGKVVGTFSVAAGVSVAVFIGCGGGGGGVHSSGSSSTGGSAGTGYSSGGKGGNNANTNGQQSGGGAGGGSSAVCVYGTSSSPCATLLSVAGGGGGGGGAGCTGNGGQGGNGNAGATTGSSATSETNSSAPGGSAGGQGFGGGGGGADGASQAYGGGGGGGVGAAGATSSTSPTTGGSGAGNSTGGAGGGNSGAGGITNGTAGSGPNASGTGANGADSPNADTQHPGGGGGGGGYYGGGSGSSNGCTLTPSLGGGGGGAGSSWVSTSHLTTFANGSNPAFTAGSPVNSSACGQSQNQGTSGATTGAGGEGFPSTSGTGGGYAGCPGTASLTWSALPGAPSGVTGNGSPGQITGSWTAPADPGTGSIIGYTLTATPVPSGTPVSQTFNSTASTETLTGLATGASYDLSVAAVTGVGTGPAADASNNPITTGSAPSLTSANSATFVAGSAGSFSATATGSPTPSISESGSLPSGVTFTDNGNGTATLSGTPAPGTGGSYPLTFDASNGISPDGSQSFTLTVDQSPAITSGSAATFTAGSEDSFTVTTSGVPAPSISESGHLPSGVSFTDNGNGTATLSGTPATGTDGTYPINFDASNGITPDASQSFTLTVDQSPAITSAAGATFSEGSAGSFTVTTSGLPDPALTETGALPSGVTFIDNGNGTATLAGTPAGGSNGVYPVTIDASNGIIPAASQPFTLTVDGPPTITSAPGATFSEGLSGSFTVTTHAEPTAALTETGALPSGVSFVDNGDGTGTLSGVPASGSSGVYSIELGASNGISPDGSQSFTLTVDVAPTINSGNGATFVVGSAGSFSVHTTGLPAASLTESGALPNGVTFTDQGDGTAILGGTPSAGTSGVYNFTIDASNGVSPDATQSFTLTVDAAPAITSADSATFTEGSAGSFTVSSSARPTASLTENGSLPPGVSFSDNGDGTATLSGTPAAGSHGVYTVLLTASNGAGPDATQSFTLTVDAAPAISSADSATFTEGSAGSFTVTTSGLPGASLAETGALPSGVAFTDNGDGSATLAGTPDAGTNGTYPITIVASNGISPDGSQSFTLFVDEAPVITSANSTTLVEGEAGSFTVVSSGNPAASLTESGALPSGISFTDNGNGTATLAGTPAAGTSGDYGLSITASNGASPDATQSFTLTVDAAPSITSANSTTLVEGEAGSFTVVSSGNPTASLTESGALPSGVSFTDNGNGTATLAGTPAAGTSGDYGLSITASNGVSPDASQTFTLTVDEAPTITSGSAAAFVAGSSSSFTVISTGFPTATLSEAGALPSGVTFTDNGNGTAALAGTPAVGTTGGYAITITAGNGVNPNATQAFVLDVEGPPVITSADAATLVEGVAGSFTVTATGPPAASLSESGGLPNGVTFTDNGNGTASLAGTPSAGTRGVYVIVITADNGVSPDATQSFTLTVDAVPVFSSASSVILYYGTHGSFTPTATGSPAPVITEFGNLPPGLTFSRGVLTGTPTARGTFPMLFTADNGVGGPVTQSFTLQVNGLVITTSSLPVATVGATYNVQLTAVGGKLPIKWGKVGALPRGLKINAAGLLAGTVSAKVLPRTYTITVKVQDSGKPKQKITATLQLTVRP